MKLENLESVNLLMEIKQRMNRICAQERNFIFGAKCPEGICATFLEELEKDFLNQFRALINAYCKEIDIKIESLGVSL